MVKLNYSEPATSESSGAGSQTDSNKLIANAYGVGLSLEGRKQILEASEPQTTSTEDATPSQQENPSMDLTTLIETMPVINIHDDNHIECVNPSGSLDEPLSVNWWEVFFCTPGEATTFRSQPCISVRRDFQRIYTKCGRSSGVGKPYDQRSEAILYDYCYRSNLAMLSDSVETLYGELFAPLSECDHDHEERRTWILLLQLLTEGDVILSGSQLVLALRYNY